MLNCSYLCPSARRYTQNMSPRAVRKLVTPKRSACIDFAGARADPNSQALGRCPAAVKARQTFFLFYMGVEKWIAGNISSYLLTGQKLDDTLTSNNSYFLCSSSNALCFSSASNTAFSWPWSKNFKYECFARIVTRSNFEAFKMTHDLNVCNTCNLARSDQRLALWDIMAGWTADVSDLISGILESSVWVAWLILTHSNVNLPSNHVYLQSIC